MVEETIRTVRETEKQAQEIVDNARLESERTIKAAKERSEALREEILGKAYAEAAAEAEKAQQAGAETERRAKAECEEETAKLKTSAGEKEKEAVEMVISLLV